MKLPYRLGRSPLLLKVAFLVSLFWTVSSCSSGDGSSPDTSSEIEALDDIASSDQMGEDTEAVDLAEEETATVPAQWISVEPGGDTVCSDGSPFRYFVYTGSSERVLVYMQGGGACWNDLTCALGGSMSPQSCPTEAEFLEGVDSHRYDGVLDQTNPDNPFLGWTIVYVPYCTSDIHWGQNTKEYAGGLVQHHMGFVNASSAMNWIYEHRPNPDMVVASGCSAGGYGALLHSTYLAEHYPTAAVRVLVDSAAGVTAGTFIADAMEVWNARPGMPAFIPALANADFSTITFQQVFSAIASHFPQHRYALYSPTNDELQIFIYKAMGGKEADWPQLNLAAADSLLSSEPNFTCYLPAGTLHCVLPFKAFYLRQIDGTVFRDWVAQLVLNELLPEDLRCQGADCSHDVLCDDCSNLPEEDFPFYCDACAGGVGGY